MQPGQSHLHEKKKGDAIFNEIAQSTVEICHLDFFKVATLTILQKKQWPAPFLGVPLQSLLQANKLIEFFKLSQQLYLIIM